MARMSAGAGLLASSCSEGWRLLGISQDGLGIIVGWGLGVARIMVGAP